MVSSFGITSTYAWSNPNRSCAGSARESASSACRSESDPTLVAKPRETNDLPAGLLLTASSLLEEIARTAPDLIASS